MEAIDIIGKQIEENIGKIKELQEQIRKTKQEIKKDKIILKRLNQLQKKQVIPE